MKVFLVYELLKSEKVKFSKITVLNIINLFSQDCNQQLLS